MKKIRLYKISEIFVIFLILGIKLKDYSQILEVCIRENLQTPNHTVHFKISLYQIVFEKCCYDISKCAKARKMCFEVSNVTGFSIYSV